MSAVVLSHNTANFNRALFCGAFFEAVNKLLFLELSFNVFCWDKQATAKNAIKILSCFGNTLGFFKIKIISGQKNYS